MRHTLDGLDAKKTVLLVEVGENKNLALSSRNLEGVKLAVGWLGSWNQHIPSSSDPLNVLLHDAEFGLVNGIVRSIDREYPRLDFFEIPRGIALPLASTPTDHYTCGLSHYHATTGGGANLPPLQNRQAAQARLDSRRNILR